LQDQMEDQMKDLPDAKSELKPANHVDVEIGQRIKQRRKSMSISQEKLGEALGVSFQQIQKYEKGMNRISVSSLKTIAQFLETNPIYFYGDSAPAPQPGFAESGDGFDVVKMLRDPELKELSRAFASIKDETVRKTILDLVRSLSPNKER
jgi:transcriptional regulator with XRE-family HTH domain